MSSETLVALYDGFVAQLAVFEAGGIHCREGCGYCCHSRVSVSVAEVVLIVHWLRV